MTKKQKIAYNILRVLISLIFLSAAIPKLLGSPQAVAGFAVAHLPVWFMYFIGACELLGLIGIWIPKFKKLAAYGLLIILVGAVIVSAIYVGVLTAILPLVTGILLVIMLKMDKKKDMPASVPPATTPTM